MAKELLQEVAQYKKLYRDPDTGIAWVADGSSGTAHGPHPSIDSTGSVKGMKARGYWRQDAQTVRSNGFIYNISESMIEDEYDQIAADHCQCGGQH